VKSQAAVKLPVDLARCLRDKIVLLRNCEKSEQLVKKWQETLVPFLIAKIYKYFS
jgi:hypothetical protein